MLARRASRLLLRHGLGQGHTGGGFTLHTDAACALLRPQLAPTSSALDAWRRASWQAARVLLGPVVPLTAAELSRGVWLYAHAVNSQQLVTSTPPRHATAAAALALPTRVPLQLAVRSLAETVLTLARAVHLVLLFAPLVFTAPLCLLHGFGRAQWMETLNSTLRAAGPAFIKWGQWAATRADLFPPDMCAILTSLQSDAPCHDFRHTRATVEAAFGQPLEVMFLSFDTAPVASGSIAQVHRATLNPDFLAQQQYAVNGIPLPAETAAPRVVAVKVRHPRVDTIITRDFAILRVVADLAGMLPGIKWMRLDESVRQFREPLFEQVDLSREAHNLRIFNHNFAKWRRVSFPKPIEPLVAPSVLVESFEEGVSISTFMKKGDPQLRRSVADLGVKTLLKMMLADNWVHADLHPGNILVRIDQPSRQNLLRRWLRPKPVPHIVLLDCGMTASLSDRNKENLVNFFEAITRGDGRGVAEMALAFSERQTCPQPQAFVDDLVGLFSTAVAWGFEVNTSEWMAAVLESVRRHQVHLASEVCSVVVTALVLEGWSNRLDPDICIMQQIRQVVFGSDRLRSRLEELAKLLS